jgi:glycine/D-amino acid oxidase-like deaminating enzyme
MCNSTFVPERFDAVIVGAGIVGAACAYFLADAGASVLVLDRGAVASGTTGAGEGNILLSDKQPGPELELAVLSTRLWRELGTELGPAIELEAKGGLTVASSAEALESLIALADAQRAGGVEAQMVGAGELRQYEPHLADGLAGGVSYPDDMQVQPMLAAAHLLARARHRGAHVRAGCELQAVLRDHHGAISGVSTSGGVVSCPIVVNAAGTWGAEVASWAGVELPILPRRGFILVTEPLPVTIRHKVYTADYVANVASGSEGLESSTVVEGTRSGTILIGATRERVGFDHATSWRALGRIAAGAIALFPFLSQVRALRTYRGFRPYCPDHLPVVGPDRRVPGLLHACGHEGAGIGLAPATGRLIAQAATGAATDLSLEPFAPDRFAPAHA